MAPAPLHRILQRRPTTPLSGPVAAHENVHLSRSVVRRVLSACRRKLSYQTHLGVPARAASVRAGRHAAASCQGTGYRAGVFSHLSRVLSGTSATPVATPARRCPPFGAI